MRIVHMIHYLAKQPFIVVAYIVKTVNLISDTHYRHIYRLQLSDHILYLVLVGRIGTVKYHSVEAVQIRQIVQCILTLVKL